MTRLSIPVFFLLFNKGFKTRSTTSSLYGNLLTFDFETPYYRKEVTEVIQTHERPMQESISGFYKKKGIILDIDGTQPIAKVSETIARALKND